MFLRTVFSPVKLSSQLLSARCLHATAVNGSLAAGRVCEKISLELAEIQAAGTFKNERIIHGRQGVSINLANSDTKLLNFCANNYLGLSSDRSVIEAGKKTLESHGAGLSSVRFICGTQDIHRELEQKLAKFHSRDDAILYAACFDANAGIFEVLLGPDDAVISDELNHASIIDGIRLCKAHRYRYKHLDMADLQRCLEESQLDIINSTLGKALGGAMGGYTVAPQPMVDLLRQRSRPYLFSNSLAPAVVGSSIKVLDMLIGDASHAQSCARAKTAHFRQRMKANGFHVLGDPAHPICPVMLGDARLATEFANLMLLSGIYVIGFSYPVVPKGKARIRVQISAAHDVQMIDRCVDAFVEVGRELGVI